MAKALERLKAAQVLDQKMDQATANDPKLLEAIKATKGAETKAEGAAKIAMTETKSESD